MNNEEYNITFKEYFFKHFFKHFFYWSLVISICTYWNDQSEKKIKKEVREQQRNDYSDALIKNCERFDK